MLHRDQCLVQIDFYKTTSNQLFITLLLILTKLFLSRAHELLQRYLYTS